VYIYKHIKDEKIQEHPYSSLEAAINAAYADFHANTTRPIGIYSREGKIILNRNQLLKKFALSTATEETQATAEESHI